MPPLFYLTFFKIYIIINVEKDKGTETLDTIFRVEIKVIQK